MATALIDRMPPSGNAPLKPFVLIQNALTARITCRPFPGSAPSKLFASMLKNVTALIDRMPPSGSDPLKPFLKIKTMLTARITWRPLAGSAPSKLFV
eukprot:2772058-Amphidinium_carterae.1